MADSRFRTREIAFKGRLRTADDPTTIAPEDMSVCKNMRPSDQIPRGMGGMTKINTSALASTGIRNMYHFRKSLPVETHILAWTSDGKVWVNDTTVPNQGAFDVAALFTDTAGGSTGRFAPAPGGALAYANGKEACLWGGDQYRCAGFIDYPTTGQIYDYSDLITNTKTDAQNVATIHAVEGASVDAATMLLLHLDNNVTDSSPTTEHTVTNTNVTFSTTEKQFGTHGGVWNGTNAHLSIPDNADFDFSDGTWCIELRLRAPKTTAGTTILYHHGTDANNYMQVQAVQDSDGVTVIKLSIVAASSEVVSVSTVVGLLGTLRYPISVSENGDVYSIHISGIRYGYLSSANRPANYTSTVYIGSDGSGSWFNGYMDEVRISNVARNTTYYYLPSSSAFGSGYASTTYIGSIMPLDGVKFTVVAANPLSSGTATMEMHEWTGNTWSALTITDNTALSSRALEQTGTVTWASTAATSIPTVVEKVYLYWYKMVITSDSDFGGITLSNVTVSIPFQATRDLWDGEERPCNSFVVFDSPKYLDYTSNVLENGFTSTGADIDASTFAKLVSLTTTDYLYVGFIERMAGITLYIIDDFGNTNSVVVSWEYWNGSAWTGLTATDGTVDGAKSLAKSGWVTWPPADRTSEFKRTDLGVGSTYDKSKLSAYDRLFFGDIKNVPTGASKLKSTGPLYYYRASFSGAMSADVRIYHVAGIPAPKDIRGYSFPAFHQNRPVLVSNTDGAKNTILLGAQDTANVFNGLDAYEFPFGQDSEINAAASLFLRFGSSVQDMMVLTKPDEVHLLEGNGSDSDPYRTRLLSTAVGCRAPLTMATVPVGDLGGGIRRQIAIWESQRGIEVFDGAALLDPLLSHDIRDKFDPNHANYAGSSSNAGFYDAVYDEYHWLPVGSAEWVYSFKYKKWYQPVRGTGKYLYGGIPVMDTSGNSYSFGFDNAGYVYRLENGTDFDGNDIAHTLKTGAIALDQNQISQETTLRMVKVVQVAKNTTANNMTVTHFGDTETTGKTVDAAFSPAASGKRLKSRILNAGSRGPFVHHEFQLALTTNDETCGCEPIYLVAYYDGERQDVR